LLDRIDEEKRALRTILRALDGLNPDTQFSVIRRAFDSIAGPKVDLPRLLAPRQEDLRMGDPPASMVPGFAGSNGISGGGKTE
jgi:hypothetical protein